jgi:hypothetical protein
MKKPIQEEVKLLTRWGLKPIQVAEILDISLVEVAYILVPETLYRDRNVS